MTKVKAHLASSFRFQECWTATATNGHEPTPQLVGRTHNKSGKNYVHHSAKGHLERGLPCLAGHRLNILVRHGQMRQEDARCEAIDTQSCQIAQVPQDLPWREGQNGFR